MFSLQTFENADIFASTIYLLCSSKGNLLIDPGFYDENLEQALNQISTLDAILLTHGHGDHIRGVDSIMKKFPETKLYLHQEDSELLTNTELNCSYIVDKKDIIIQTSATFLKEGNLKIGGYEIEIFHFQGHTYGSVMYYFPEEKLLFLGDTIFPDTIGTTRVPTGDPVLREKSLKKFKNLNLPEDTVCYSGHGDSALFGDILSNNPFLQD